MKIRKSHQRAICAVLSLLLLLTATPFLNITASASSILTYKTLDDIPEDLQIFKTIASGNISAVKSSNTWYYQFTRSGYSTIRIKASAFATISFSNNYLKDDNTALTKSVGDKQNTTRICYYVNGQKKTYGSYDSYTTNRYRFELEAIGNETTKVNLTCRLKDFVQFTYATKVLVDKNDFERLRNSKTSKYSGKYVTPDNAYEYKKALQRSSSAPSVTPVVTLKITNTGSNAVDLSTYKISGVGQGNTSVNVSELISVGYKTSALVAKAAVNLNTAYSLYSILKETYKLCKDSGKSSLYNTGELHALSKGSKYVYSAKFTSPIKLKNASDYVQVQTYLGSPKGTSDRGTASFSVQFSFET